MDTEQLMVLAKVAGLTSSGIFAGYTWALSRATVPAIIDYGSDDEKVILAQWRFQYIDGAAFSRPCCLLNALSFGYLAYESTSPSYLPNHFIRILYIIAAIATASGVPWALTALRTTNGALSIRSKRVVGSFDNPESQPMCITYASHEKAAIQREKDPKYTSSKDLVNHWRWHNDRRTALLVFGVIVGALAVALQA